MKAFGWKLEHDLNDHAALCQSASLTAESLGIIRTGVSFNTQGVEETPCVELQLEWKRPAESWS
jgi:hypothetical protein